MQENNIIYEITQKIQDKEVVQNDFREAFILVTDMFKKKYINQLETEIKNNVEFVKNNPPKEINLLKAIKPFILENSHKSIDNLINALTNISALNYMIPEIKFNTETEIDEEKVVNISSIDPSVKNDGVYDIDESCIFSVSSSFNNSTFSYLLIIFIFIMYFNN